MLNKHQKGSNQKANLGLPFFIVFAVKDWNAVINEM